MQPKIPTQTLHKLRGSGRPAPWICKLSLRRGRMVFAVEIAGDGTITSVDGRTVYSESDIGFNAATVVDAEAG